MRRSAGRYVLGELLGRGGMAEVFAGHVMGDHGFQKPVAIKRLLPELASDEVFVARLIDEAKLLVGMAHGNIVSVLDLARDGDDVFLVMEYVDGPTLRQLLKARGVRGLPVGVATYVVQSAAAGLELAHGRAIVHADISPSNLLLTSSGEVRVADFGIARREGRGDGVVEGKWAYMAPEQARGEPLTPAADVFALGVVLYELVCGAHPFGRRVTHAERDSQPMRVIPPRVVNPAIPAGLDAIVMRALAHDPRDRFARMQHLIDAIVEERFANQWRDGAAELAAAIRVARPRPATEPRAARTQAERPVTIATRSLLRDATPAEPVAPPSRRFARGSCSAPYDVVGDTAVDRALAAPPPAPAPAHGLASGSVPVLAPAFALPVPYPAPRRRGWLLAFVGVAALAAAATTVVLQQSAGERALAASAPAPIVTPIADPPAEPPPPPPPAPAVAVAPAELAVAEPAEPPAAEPAEPAEPPATTPRARPAAAKPAAPAKKKDPGVVRTHAYPWAWVTIAGKREESGTSFKLAPGRYPVRFQHPETRKVVTRTVVVEPGRTVMVKVNWEDEE